MPVRSKEGQSSGPILPMRLVSFSDYWDFATGYLSVKYIGQLGYRRIWEASVLVVITLLQITKMLSLGQLSQELVPLGSIAHDSLDALSSSESYS